MQRTFVVCRIYRIKEIHPLKGKTHHNLFNHFNKAKMNMMSLWKSLVTLNEPTLSGSSESLFSQSHKRGRGLPIALHTAGAWRH